MWPSRRQFSGVAGALRGRCGETRAKRGRPEKLSCDEWRRRLATSSPSGRESQVPNVINTTSAAPRHDIDDYPTISDSFSLPVGCWKCKIYRICSAKTNLTALLFDSCKMTSSICACIVHYSIYHTALYIYNQLLRSSFVFDITIVSRTKKKNNNAITLPFKYMHTESKHTLAPSWMFTSPKHLTSYHTYHLIRPISCLASSIHWENNISLLPLCCIHIHPPCCSANSHPSWLLLAWLSRTFTTPPKDPSHPQTDSLDSNPIVKKATGYDYASTKTRGVNLGGWLVLEPYVEN